MPRAAKQSIVILLQRPVTLNINFVYNWPLLSDITFKNKPVNKLMLLIYYETDGPATYYVINI